MEMALTGELIPAAEAERFGLVNRVVSAAQLHGAVTALAARISSRSAQAISAGKETFYRQLDMPLEQAFSYATEAMVQGLLSQDATEGAAAFLEKRDPQWSDA